MDALFLLYKKEKKIKNLVHNYATERKLQVQWFTNIKRYWNFFIKIQGNIISKCISKRNWKKMLITSPAMNFLLVHYEKNKTEFFSRQCGSLIKTGDFHIYYVFKLKRVCNSATFFVFFSWFFLFFLRTFLSLGWVISWLNITKSLLENFSNWWYFEFARWTLKNTLLFSNRNYCVGSATFYP